jgi:hypothetical protein
MGDVQAVQLVGFIVAMAVLLLGLEMGMRRVRHRR